MTDNQAHARNTDPEPSHMAAESVDVGRTKKLVLRALNTIGSLDLSPVTADELTGIIRDNGHTVSPSGVRSRLAELVRDGRVEVADMDGRTTSGRRCRRYRIADQD